MFTWQQSLLICIPVTIGKMVTEFENRTKCLTLVLLFCAQEFYAHLLLHAYCVWIFAPKLFTRIRFYARTLLCAHVLMRVRFHVRFYARTVFIQTSVYAHTLLWVSFHSAFIQAHFFMRICIRGNVLNWSCGVEVRLLLETNIITIDKRYNKTKNCY